MLNSSIIEPVPTPRAVIKHSGLSESYADGFKLLSTAHPRADFIDKISEKGDKFAIVPLELVVPKETKYITAYVNGHDLHFGQKTYVERPFAHMGVFVSIHEWNERNNELFLYVYALLRDINGDDPWTGHVDVAVSYYGV
ncbi:hypothetical protein ACQKLN_13420 [Paenibacillus glucanolyticus]|uniref:hypothetical protein n=1 Tax=Paenibacillus glucanolyticus TaxID=59843 RepID=UPI003691825E